MLASFEWNHFSPIENKEENNMGTGCGTVGRAVAFDTRDSGFESSHWQIFLLLFKPVLTRRK